MKVFVDKELCSGSGICIEACPEVFELDDQGTTSAKNEQVSSEFEQACSRRMSKWGNQDRRVANN